MIPRDITYKDLDGNWQTKKYYFSLDMAEIAEMDMLHNGGYGEFLDQIGKSNDGPKLIKNFKKILYGSVGRREGDRLVKSQDVVDEFIQTGAYNAFFFELLSDAVGAAKFFEQIMPDDLAEKTALLKAKEADREYTDDELFLMSDEEFGRIAGPKGNWSRHHLMIALKRQSRERGAA